MKSTSVAAALRGPHLTTYPPRIILVPDRFGDLPALLVDPVDQRGRTVSGMWLLAVQPRRRVDAVYEWVETRAYA